jgi:replication factor A1
MKTEMYIKRIIEETGLSKKEIEDRVNDKKKELKGLISEEGALFIIAKELGVEIKDNQQYLNDIEIKVSDIKPQMKNITLVGRVKQINRVHTFKRKDGSEGRVGSFLLHDQTGDIRIVLWDENTKILKDTNFDINELIKVINGYAREGRYNNLEIHLGRLGKIILSPEDVDYSKYPKIEYKAMEISNVDPEKHDLVSIEGKIINKFPINEFTKKDGTQGKVCSVILMDSTGSIRVTFWNNDIEKIKDYDSGDSVFIKNLKPRKSNFNEDATELYASYNTSIKSMKKDLEIKGKMIKDLSELQNKKGVVSFKGIVSSVDNLKNVILKSGEEVKLLGFTVSDETDGIRVTLWRENAEKYANKLKNGQGVLLENVIVRYSNFSGRNEISFIKDSDLKFIDLEIENLKEIDITSQTPKSSFTREYTKISEINSKGFFEIKGFIPKELNNITIYTACPQCYRKIEDCTCEESSSPEERMILNTIIDDGYGTIRTTFIGDLAENLIEKKTEVVSKIKDTPDFDSLLRSISSNLMGKDLIIKGKSKFSDFSNKYELVAFDFKKVEPLEELEEIFKDLST